MLMDSKQACNAEAKFKRLRCLLRELACRLSRGHDRSEFQRGGSIASTPAAPQEGWSVIDMA